MLTRSALRPAVLAALALAGLSLWPAEGLADPGAGFRGGSAGAARAHSGDAGFRGGARFGSRFGAGGFARGEFGRGGFRGRHGFAHRGATLGDRFRVHQRARLTGIPLPSHVLIGDAELVAQRRRFNEKFLARDRLRDRRFFHKRAFFPRPFYFPWAPGVPGDDPPVIIVQIVSSPPRPPAPPAPSVAAAPAAQTLDPRGRITVVGEDEAEQAGDAWSQGDVLPREVPHITLDYAAYGLPTPSLGEKYARVGNEVLRIDTGSRRIVEVVAR
jgi:Ni/Co efflux regulator RcnB